MNHDSLKERVRSVEPWIHDIDLGPFATFDVAKSTGPYAHVNHPEPRAQAIIEFLPRQAETVLDLGCNAGGIAFRVEAEDLNVTGVDDNEYWEDHPNDQRTPKEQFEVAKDALDSDVEFINSDVRDYLESNMKFDVIVAAGLLYHMGRTVPEIRAQEPRNTTAEKSFVDQLNDARPTRVIVETNYTPWLEDYLDDCRIIANKRDNPDGVRHLVAWEP